MARHKMKGGEDDFIGNMVAAGVGAYAAKNATSMGGLLWTLAKYALIILAILLGIAVLGAIIRAATRAHFVPTVPSAEGDQRLTTPAGNVITY